MGKRVKRCVILAAGPVAEPAALRPLLRPDDAVIAADGGRHLAHALGVKPLAVVADFDSSSREDADDGVPTVTLPVRKDVTDTAAATEYARRLGYRDFLLLGGTGGRLDHQYANELLLVRLAKDGCHAVLADERNRIEAVTVSPLTVPPLPGWKTSFFAFGGPVRDLTITGAAYPLTGYTLLPEDALCVSNAVEQTPCTVTFTDGILLVCRSKD